MKNFLFNTPIGVIITIIIIGMISITLSTTACVFIWGLGVMVFNDLRDNNIINTNIIITTTTVWTLFNIVFYIIVTIWLWLDLMVTVNSRYNLDKNEK